MVYAGAFTYLLGFTLWWQVLLGIAIYVTVQGLVHYLFYGYLFLLKKKHA